MIGPNGAGKTTTMRLLLDIIRPSGGELSVLGESPRDGGALRRRIGYLPGELHLSTRVKGRELLAHYAEISGPVRRRDRRARRPARRRPRPTGAQPVEGQQAEDRPDPGVHARTRAARARRADQRARPARAAGVPRDAARGACQRADGVPQLARAERGAADRARDRDPQGGAHRRAVDGRGAPRERRAPRQLVSRRGGCLGGARHARRAARRERRGIRRPTVPARSPSRRPSTRTSTRS